MWRGDCDVGRREEEGEMWRGDCGVGRREEEGEIWGPSADEIAGNVSQVYQLPAPDVQKQL